MPTLYEQDFYLWTKQQAELLRNGQWAAIDPDNLAEEIETMGGNNKRELVSRLAVLLTHLLKWQFQPERQGVSWLRTIKGQRHSLRDILEQSPSLHHEIDHRLAIAYARATDQAAMETGLAESLFPATCPYTIDQILGDFLPE